MRVTACKYTLAALALGLAACSDRKADGAADGNAAATATTAASQPSLTKALESAPGLASVAQMVKRAGLERTFDGAGSYTFFAPTDTAIAKLPEAERRQLASDSGRPQLIALLRQHIAPGYIARTDLDRGLAHQASVRVATVGSAPIILRKQGSAILLGTGSDAPRLSGDPITAGNGVIFPIDRVLPPPRRRPAVAIRS